MSSTTTTTTTAAPRAVGTSSVPSGDVTASLNFFTPPADGSAPHNYVEVPTDGTPQRNFESQDKHVLIKDLRGHEGEFTLDKAGFAALGAGSNGRPQADFSSDERIKETYYPEVERILKDEIPGTPQRVFIFDHTVRRQAPDAHRAPVSRVHIDQTPKSAAARVQFHMGDEAETLLKGRVRLINVWRPLNGPVESWPLAVADSTTVPDSLLTPIEHRYPTRTGETAGVQYGPDPQWYYLSGMRNDERLLLQCFDSQSGSRVPHTGFEDPRSTEASKPRESIEVRALVFG